VEILDSFTRIINHSAFPKTVAFCIYLYFYTVNQKRVPP